MRTRFGWLFLLIYVAAIACCRVEAQVTSAGSVSGEVTDSTGASAAGVNILAVQTETHGQWHAISDEKGSFIFANLPVGTFTLSAEKAGFRKQQINSLVLHAGDNLKVNFALAVGDVSEVVEVSSDPITVDTQTANVGDVVTAKTIHSLPLVTRNFIKLVEIVPGVSSDIGSEPGFGSNSSLAASVNGVRQNANNWTVDGVPNLDVYNGNNAIVPNVDALAEFRIDRGNYSAEQGRSAGATVNAILASGSNQFHGSAFEFFRNGALNANNYFSNLNNIERPAEHYNNWGYTFGGPVVKNKLFFFWSQEWRHISQASGTYQARVPTDLEKSGDFSNYAATGVTQPIVTGALAANPACTGCVAGSPFPNNKIPAALLNANAKALLDTYYPTAQTYNNGYNFASAEPTTTTVREELIRLDYNLSDKWKAFAHYIQDQNHITSPYQLWNDNVLPNVAGSKEFEPLHSFAINLVGTITPNLINEVQFSIFHNLVRITMDDTVSRSRASNLNIPYYFADHTNVANRIPNLSFQRYAGIVSDFPFLNGFFYHKWNDNLSWHRGNHNYRFGLLVTEQGKNENNSNSLTNGSFTFRGTQTGNDLADMLLGYADQYSETQTNPMQHLRYWDAEAYVQDQWQISRRLSLTYGLRYTYYGPEVDQNNLFSNFVPILYNSALAPGVTTDGTLENIPATQMLGNAYMPNNGIIVAGANSPYGSAVYRMKKLNLSPRIGLSFDPIGDGKTAIRAGYGRYLDRTAPYGLGAKSNPPFNSTVTLYNVSLDSPSNGSSVYSPVSLTAFNTNYSLPYSQQWSLGVQREVAKSTVLTVDYVGTRGTHLLYTRQLNQNQPSAAVADGTVNVNQVRPYLGYGAITYYNPEASASYHGLQMSVRNQISSALTLNAAYTYSKVLTDASTDGYSPQNSYDLKADRGPASFDRKHMFVASYVWQLPGLGANGLVHSITGGWQWSGILKVTSGVPITVSNGTYLNSGVLDSTQRPDLIGHAQDGNGINDWLNVNAFSNPIKGTFGNAGVGIARMPRQTQFDTAVSKEFHIYEALRMQLRIEAINAFNHTLFSGVDSNYYPNSATFGHITSATSPRKAQIGAHFTF